MFAQPSNPPDELDEEFSEKAQQGQRKRFTDKLAEIARKLRKTEQPSDQDEAE